MKRIIERVWRRLLTKQPGEDRPKIDLKPDEEGAKRVMAMLDQNQKSIRDARREA